MRDTATFIHRPQDFRDAALLVERREANSSPLECLQLMVGESEPTEISTARFMNRSLIIRNGRNPAAPRPAWRAGPWHAPRQIRRTLPRPTCAGRRGACQRGCRLPASRVGAVDVRCTAPPPDVQDSGVQVFQADEGSTSGLGSARSRRCCRRPRRTAPAATSSGRHAGIRSSITAQAAASGHRASPSNAHDRDVAPRSAPSHSARWLSARRRRDPVRLLLHSRRRAEVACCQFRSRGSHPVSPHARSRVRP